MAKKGPRNPLDDLGPVNSIEEALARARALGDQLVKDPELARSANISQVGNPITVQVVPSAEEMASDLITNARNAASKWERKIQTPRASFKEAGLAAKGKHKQKTMEALQEDRYAKGMQRVNEDEAIQTALAVGGTGYAAGISAREAKIRRVFGELQPRFTALARSIRAMKQDTDADREARLLAARRGMIDIGKARRGG